MSIYICAGCGESAHRSKAKTLIEKGIRNFSNYRLYSCHKCGTRKWVLREGVGQRAISLKTTLIFLLVLFFTIAAALYWTDQTVKKAQSSQGSGN
jgi:DNA-directed RNA polymerase subunit RPC12/RpoP